MGPSLYQEGMILTGDINSVAVRVKWSVWLGRSIREYFTGNVNGVGVSRRNRRREKHSEIGRLAGARGVEDE